MSVVDLYVPGSRPDRFDKAVATSAEVILDLEDAVAPADKPAAREAVAAWLDSASRGSVQVRVNAPGTAELAADLEALADVPGVALRVPKVESAEELTDLGDRPLHVLLETGLGLERAFEIASAPGVAGVALGEADLRAALAVDDDAGLSWARQRLVVACAAAGRPAPLMSVYPDIADLDGLRAFCARGRALGFWGASAIHPSQVPVIREAFTPTAAERAWAESVLAALDTTGVATLADGSMVDAAMARRAERLLAR